jgi:hypothetical protein
MFSLFHFYFLIPYFSFLMPGDQRHIEIMDTTLRDGEQTSGVSFSPTEKLTIAQLLLTEVKVDRIEIGQKPTVF